MSDPNKHIKWNKHQFELLRYSEFKIKDKINISILSVYGAAGSLTKVTIENKSEYDYLEIKFYWSSITNEKRNRIYTIESGKTEHIEVSSLYQITVFWRIV
jgi:hypothetical protein